MARALRDDPYASAVEMLGDVFHGTRKGSGLQAVANVGEEGLGGPANYS